MAVSADYILSTSAIHRSSTQQDSKDKNLIGKEPMDINVSCQNNINKFLIESVCESKDTEDGSVRKQNKKKKRKHKETNREKQTDGTNKDNELSVKENPLSDSSDLEKNNSGKKHKKKHKKTK